MNFRVFTSDETAEFEVTIMKVGSTFTPKIEVTPVEGTLEEIEELENWKQEVEEFWSTVEEEVKDHVIDRFQEEFGVHEVEFEIEGQMNF